VNYLGRNKKQPGLTMIEMVTAIVISGIIVIGLSLSARTVLAHYQIDTIRLDARYYGNTLIREITKKMNLAKQICVDRLNGFSRLDLSWTDKYGFTNNTIITANANDGILFDYQFPLDGVLTLPNKGAFRSRNQFHISLQNFDVLPQPITSGLLSDFSRSTWDIILELKIDMNNAPGGSRIEILRFERTVFMPNRFITMKDQTCL